MEVSMLIAPNAKEATTLTYLMLRKAVGGIAVLLPFALAIPWWLLRDHALQSSISDYYYTGMRDRYVPALLPRIRLERRTGRDVFCALRARRGIFSDDAREPLGVSKGSRVGALCVCRTAVSDASVLLPDIIQDDRHEPDRDQQEIAEEQGLYGVRMGDPGVDPGH